MNLNLLYKIAFCANEKFILKHLRVTKRASEDCDGLLKYKPGDTVILQTWAMKSWRTRTSPEDFQKDSERRSLGKKLKTHLAYSSIGET